MAYTGTKLQNDALNVEQARETVMWYAERLEPETVSVLDAVGRVIAEEQVAEADIPEFAYSLMDGYAVRREDLANATADAPVVLDVVAEEAAGQVFEGACEPGQCIRIMTGAPVPAFADAIVKLEDAAAQTNDGSVGGQVAFSMMPPERANIREAAAEMEAGETIVGIGEVITMGTVGSLVNCGITEVPVYRRPKVAIIATGSELVDPSEVPGPGKIRNSNSLSLAAQVRDAGGIPTVMPIVPDDVEAIKAAISAAIADYDYIITTGGVSGGDFDYVTRAIGEIGTLFMTKVKMMPGGSQTFGIVQGRPVYGLPGSPAAAFVGFEVIVRAALRKMQGFVHRDRPRVVALLETDYEKTDSRRIFDRAIVKREKHGAYSVTPAPNQSVDLFEPIHHANCLMLLREGKRTYAAGDRVECVLLDIDEEAAL